MDIKAGAEKLLVNVVGGLALATLTVFGNWASSGGVIRLLGGVAKSDLPPSALTLTEDQVQKIKALSERLIEFGPTSFCVQNPGVKNIKTCFHSDGNIGSYAIENNNKPLYSLKQN